MTGTIFSPGKDEKDAYVQVRTVCISTSSSEDTGLKGPQEISSSASCTKQGQAWSHTTLATALFTQVLKTAKDGDCTASPGNAFPCPAVPAAGAQGWSVPSRPLRPQGYQVLGPVTMAGNQKHFCLLSINTTAAPAAFIPTQALTTWLMG